MTTYVLLHGAWHGAWCWTPLQRELTAMGARGVAMDLPADEPTAGIDRYVDVACEAVPDGDDVVIVAHSLAGLVAPIVAHRVGARGLIMLAALWPQPGRSAREQARELPGIYTEAYRQAPMIRHDDGSTALPPDTARDLLFGDCDPATAAAASAQLRPQHWRLWADVCPLTQWPSVPTAGLAGRHDRMLGPEGMRVGSARVGAPLTWLESGHSPMLSMPDQLVRFVTNGLWMVEERTIGP